MKNQIIISILIVLLIISSQSYAGWVISSGTKVKVPSGKIVSIDGNLSLKNTAEINNEGRIVVTGNFDNQGETQLGNGIYQFKGSNSQQITGSFEFGTLTVNSGASFEIQPGSAVTITNSVYNSNGVDGIVVKSDASGLGSFIHTGTGKQGTVEQYLTSERWHLVSPAISDAQIGSYYDIYLKEWDEPTASWTYLVDPLTLPLNPGTGYSAWAGDEYTGSTTVEHTGTLNASDIALSLDYTPASSETGWNLVGNPFSSAIDWNTNWTMNDVGGWAVVYDNTVYRGWNPYLSPGSQSYNGKTDGIIPMTQGFWVRATDAGAAMTIPAGERLHSSQAFYKESTEVEAPTLRLTAQHGEETSEAVVIFFPGATTDFDGLYDLERFENGGNAPNFYSQMGGSELSVNVLPEYFTSGVDPKVNLGFQLPVSGNCQINASGIETFDSDLPVYLEDLKENEMIDLRSNPEYSFYSTDMDDANRFILHFADPLGLDELETESFVQIYGGNDEIIISLSESVNGIAKVFDLTGREITELKLQVQETRYSLPAVERNYYLVQVVGESGVWNEKLYVY